MEDKPKGAGKTTPTREAFQEQENYPKGRAEDKGAKAGLGNTTTRAGRDVTNTVITKSSTMYVGRRVSLQTDSFTL